MNGLPSPGAAVVAAADEARALLLAGDPTFLSVLDDEVVQARAAALEESADGHWAGRSLVGLAVAAKDNIDVAGLPTTSACAPSTYRPERSAVAVERLEAAGAVVVAKTNLDQFATGLVGLRSPHGAPVNPCDPALIPGGSSSGSAVAVARGVVPLALGTDTAGSGRVPAAMTGTIGCKPAPGRVPTTGVVPACWSLDCISLFTRELGTAQRAVAVLDPQRPWRPVTPGVVGMADGPSLAGTDPTIASGFAEVGEMLGENYAVEAVDLEALLRIGSLLYGGPWLAERVAALGPLLAAHRESVDPAVAQVLAGAAGWSAVDAFEAMHTRAELLAGPVADLWRRIDVLVVPTVPWLPTVAEVVADPLGTNQRLGRFTHFANLAGLAALAVPVPGVRAPHEAVPHHVTLLAPSGREGMLIVAAAALGVPGGAGLAGARPEGDPGWPDTGPDDAGWVDGGRVSLAVVGAHLSGFPLEHQLIEAGGRLEARTTTDACYRLWRLAGEGLARPALERVPGQGAAIEAEVWSVPQSALGGLLAQIPPPLALGTVVLAGGEHVAGFVCEAGGLAGAEDITEWGGWRRWWADAQGPGSRR